MTVRAYRVIFAQGLVKKFRRLVDLLTVDKRLVITNEQVTFEYMEFPK